MQLHLKGAIMNELEIEYREVIQENYEEIDQLLKQGDQQRAEIMYELNDKIIEENWDEVRKSIKQNSDKCENDN